MPSVFAALTARDFETVVMLPRIQNGVHRLDTRGIIRLTSSSFLRIPYQGRDTTESVAHFRP